MPKSPWFDFIFAVFHPNESFELIPAAALGIMSSFVALSKL
jgi:hypothetical protein